MADSRASLDVARELLSEDDPSLRLRALRVLGGSQAERDAARAAVRSCERTAALLAAREPDGRLRPVRNVYQKWYGAHWVLVDLAEIGYPPEDTDMYPIRDQVYENWLARRYREPFACSTPSQAYAQKGVPVMNGRARRCASQQGNALYATVALGIADERAHDLVELLLGWQWPDGGWNCDKNPAASTSSFHETVTPIRGLNAYARWSGARPQLRERAEDAVRAAAEVFLTRRLYRRRHDGSVIDRRFLEVAYPPYWRYDILFGLVVMNEIGMVQDPRCEDALETLREMELPSGGWPSFGKHYRRLRVAEPKGGSGLSRVEWGPHGKTRGNPWVTLNALDVLSAAAR